MDPIALARKKYIQVQTVLAICMGFLVFGLRWGVFDQFEEAIWFGSLVAIEIFIGGGLVWNIFQFYQPKKTFSFNPIFILLTISLLIGYGFYTLSNFNPWMDREHLYNIGFPFHLVALFFLFWILYYEWWFLKQEIRNEYNTKRLLGLQEDLKNAEIKNIQQNVQPHFLFNSLNSINSLMLIDVEEAQHMIVKLSEFLRHSVMKNQKMYISLADELAQIDRYFSIEKIRFASRLNYEITCPEELKKIEIPSMLLQPLLENAIKYGIYGTVQQSCIRLQVDRVNNYLIIRMENPYDPDQGASKGTGFGLKSVRQKLYWLYAEANLLDTKTQGDQFITKLKIPLRDESNTD